jgi:hypothetical protein
MAPRKSQLFAEYGEMEVGSSRIGNTVGVGKYDKIPR